MLSTFIRKTDTTNMVFSNAFMFYPRFNLSNLTPALNRRVLTAQNDAPHFSAIALKGKPSFRKRINSFTFISVRLGRLLCGFLNPNSFKASSGLLRPYIQAPRANQLPAYTSFIFAPLLPYTNRPISSAANAVIAIFDISNHIAFMFFSFTICH